MGWKKIQNGSIWLRAEDKRRKKQRRERRKLRKQIARQNQSARGFYATTLAESGVLISETLIRSKAVRCSRPDGFCISALHQLESAAAQALESDSI